MNKTAISWSNRTWNSIHGCSKVSDGCKHCYAMTLSLKNGWTKHDWTVQHESENVLMKPHKLHEPYTLTEPQRVFTNSMSDMFHRAVPDWYRAAMFCVMLDLPQHVFQVLTKRSDALAGWDARFLAAVRSDEFKAFTATVKRKDVKAALEKAESYTSAWADHIWQGVSVEDGRVLHRIDDLRRCAAHVKFISAEPLLGAWGADVDLSGIDWIIAGGESGDHMIVADEHGKRVPNEKRWMKMEWAREIKALCVDQGTAFFYKQDSGYNTEQRKYLVEEDGTHWEWNQYPGDLVPPRELGKAYNYFGEIHQTEDTSLNLCLYMAHLWENRAYANEGFRADNAAITSAYWYAAAARLRPAPPQAVTTPDPLLTTALDLGATVTPTADPDPIPPVPLQKVEPDYADPFGLPETAKVISLWQPWATLLMIEQGKRIETRSWKTNYRGILVIHAAKQWDADLKAIANSEPFASVLRANGYDPNALPLGAALGTVILDRCIPSEQLEGVLSEQERAFGDFSAGRYGWMTSRPRLFREPLPVAGEQGLRDWSSYLAKIAPERSGTKRDDPAPEASSKTTVVHFQQVYQHWNKATQTWDDPRYAYIGRYMPSFNLPSSLFANPFKIASDTPANRATAIEQYRTWITGKLNDPEEGAKYRAELEALRGRTLACWCKSPDGDPAKSKACHGDVLVGLLGEADDPPTAPQPEPERVEAAPKQMSLFGDEFAPKRKTYA